jgi:hypothetical protein
MTGSDHDDDESRTHVVLTRGTIVSYPRIISKTGDGGMGVKDHLQYRAGLKTRGKEMR